MKAPARPVVQALLVIAVCAALGLGGILDPTHAALTGCVLLAVVLLRARRSDAPEAEWPSRPHPGRAGGRSGVSDLAWQVFGEERRVRVRVVERVADLAAARLALLGVDARDPDQWAEVERLLGAGVAAGLASKQPPTARTLQTWLDAIDRLSEERTIR